MIALPLLHANARVSDPHLIAIRNTVIGQGVATLDGLYAELIRAKQARPASKSQRSNSTGLLQIEEQLQSDVPEGTTQQKGQSIRRRILRDQRKGREPA